MKDNQDFYWKMKNKLVKYRPWSSQWLADNSTEVMLKFELPQDICEYENVIKIIFFDYRIEAELQDEICSKLALNISRGPVKHSV